MFYTRHHNTAVRISSAFAAAALIAVAGASSASAAVDPGTLPVGNLPVGDITGVTSTVTSTTGNLPVGNEVVGTATGATSVADGAPSPATCRDGLTDGWPTLSSPSKPSKRSWAT